MKKIYKKSILYVVLILLLLEILIRVFYLTKDYPTRYVDKYKVEKWKPNQVGYSVTGLRRQNFSEYRINSSGFNSYREYKPLENKLELALVGDSYIEGFHQHYYNSIGKKIEKKTEGLEVYEFGYAGYDLADQLHLIHQYKSTFDLIDHVVVSFNYKYDLERDKYNVLEHRMRLESPFYKVLQKSKLLVYLQKNGMFDAPRNLVASFFKKSKSKTDQSDKSSLINKAINKELELKKNTYNFEMLVDKYGFDKSRFIFLLDSSKTPQKFLRYLGENGFRYIDFYKVLQQSTKPTTLIYDMHWNNHGRDLIADLIVDFYKPILIK
ncbi:MAG: hypothetical protein ABJL44_14495 [Algibacter sp.]